MDLISTIQLAVANLHAFLSWLPLAQVLVAVPSISYSDNSTASVQITFLILANIWPDLCIPDDIPVSSLWSLWRWISELMPSTLDGDLQCCLPQFQSVPDECY